MSFLRHSVLASMLAFLIPVQSHAVEFRADSRLYLQTRDIDSPIYRKIAELWLSVLTDKYRSIQVEFQGKNSLVTSEKWTRRFKQSDYNDCTNDCSFVIGSLPLQLEPHVCELNIRLEDFSGAITSRSMAWGQCQVMKPRPSDRLLGDLVVNEDLSTPTEFSISNIGAPIIEKKVQVLVFLEDIAGNVIWKEKKTQDITLSNNQEATLQSSLPLRNWQRALGCRFSVVIDSDFEIHERQKINNSIQTEFGDCQELPEQARGDRFDFEPVMSVESGNVHFRVLNHGRLPMRWDYEVLEYDVLFTSAGGQAVYRIRERVTAPFYGFGEEKNVLSIPLPAGACSVSVSVNQSVLLKESNYQNNKSELTLCETSGVNQ